MINLLVTRTIMRSKPYKALLGKFDVMKNAAVRRSNQLLGISTSWKMTKNLTSWTNLISTSWKSEFRSHEIRPPDPESQHYSFSWIFSFNVAPERGGVEFSTVIPGKKIPEPGIFSRKKELHSSMETSHLYTVSGNLFVLD